MRLIRTYFSVILLAVISFSILPKEFIHELYDHHDTIESENSLKGLLHLEAIHHHCEMLTYSAFPYLDAAIKSQLQSIPVYFVKPVDKEYGFVKLDRFNLSKFRAPPIA